MKRLTVLLLAVLLVLSSCAQTSGNGNTSDANLQYILPDDVTAEMTSASYWGAKDKILLTADEIAEINAANMPCISYTDENGMVCSQKTRDIGDSFSGKILLSVLDEYELPVVAESYVSTGPMSEDFVKMLEQNVNKEAIGETVAPEFAVCVKRTILYSFPTDEPYYNEPDDFYYNENIVGEIYAGDGVVVLHTSSDGEWSFVLTEFFAGWIRNENLALCKDKTEWQKALAPEKFLVVTGDKIIFDKIVPPHDSFEEVAYMGMKIKLADKVETELNGRSTFGAYCVELPSRDVNGNLCYVKATIAISQDVSVGYLPISSKAIIEQAYKFLGHTYGWGGTEYNNDCSGIVGQIWRCFGIRLPRNSGDIAAVNGFKKVDFTDLDTNARLDALKKLPQGSLLFFSGHIMVYLGIKDNTPYCISSCGIYIPASEQGKDSMNILTANCVSINAMNLLRTNGKTWLDNIMTAVVPSK